MSTNTIVYQVSLLVPAAFNGALSDIAGANYTFGKYRIATDWSFSVASVAAGDVNVTPLLGEVADSYAHESTPISRTTKHMNIDMVNDWTINNTGAGSALVNITARISGKLPSCKTPTTYIVVS